MEGALPESGLFLTAACGADAAAHIVSVSPALATLLGYTPGELDGHSLALVHGGRVTVEEIARGMLVVQEGGRVAGGTLLTKKSGDVVFVQWEGTRAEDPAHGPVLLLTGAVADRRKRRPPVAEVEAEKLLADTVDAIALLAHDIRGPINTVIGYADLIAETPALPPDVADYVSMIVRAANRVLDMTNEITIAARLDRNEYAVLVERFELCSLIESTVALLPGADRVAWKVPADPVEVEGDLAGVRHIVANLAGNALKYSTGATPVRIEVSADEQSAFVGVHDAGIGIPADELPFVFDRFTRASNARASGVRGTGLGLYFVRRLVDRCGGTIALESRVGHGTDVSVTFPRRLRT